MNFIHLLYQMGIAEIFKAKTQDTNYDRSDILAVGNDIKQKYQNDVDALKTDIQSDASSLAADILAPIKKANDIEMAKATNKANLDSIKNGVLQVKSSLKMEYAQNLLESTDNLETVLAGFKIIGMTKDSFLTSISSNALFARGDQKDWETLRSLCEECSASDFDNNALQATLFFQSMVWEYKTGNSAYGVDGVIGKFTLTALSNIVNKITKDDLDEKYLEPAIKPAENILTPEQTAIVKTLALIDKKDGTYTRDTYSWLYAFASDGILYYNDMTWAQSYDKATGNRVDITDLPGDISKKLEIKDKEVTPLTPEQTAIVTKLALIDKKDGTYTKDTYSGLYAFASDGILYYNDVYSAQSYDKATDKWTEIDELPSDISETLEIQEKEIILTVWDTITYRKTTNIDDNNEIGTGTFISRDGDNIKLMDEATKLEVEINSWQIKEIKKTTTEVTDKMTAEKLYTQLTSWTTVDLTTIDKDILTWTKDLLTDKLREINRHKKTTEVIKLQGIAQLIVTELDRRTQLPESITLKTLETMTQTLDDTFSDIKQVLKIDAAVNNIKYTDFVFTETKDWTKITKSIAYKGTDIVSIGVDIHESKPKFFATYEVTGQSKTERSDNEFSKEDMLWLINARVKTIEESKNKIVQAKTQRSDKKFSKFSKENMSWDIDTKIKTIDEEIEKNSLT